MNKTEKELIKLGERFVDKTVQRVEVTIKFDANKALIDFMRALGLTKPWWRFW